MIKFITTLLSLLCIVGVAGAEDGFQQMKLLKDTHGGNTLTIECPNSEKPCTIKMRNSKDQEATFIDVININRTGVTWHGDDLVELRKIYGTNYSFSKFYDFKGQQIANEEYTGVFAVDPTHNLVAYCDGYLVIIKNLFDSTFKPIKISRPYAGSTESSVNDESHFTENGDLELSYLATVDGKYEDKREVIKLGLTPHRKCVCRADINFYL